MQTSIIRNGFKTEISVQVNEGIFIEGNRIPEVKNIPIEAPFKSLSSNGPIDIEFISSESESIEICADENLIDLIEVCYFGNTLEVGIKDQVNFRTTSPFKVKISYPSLKSVELSGSGNISVSNLEEHEFEAQLRGSGDINLIGKIENISLMLSGSGKINSRGLSASNVVAKLQGSGDIDAVATVSAISRLAGSGNINIYGNPPTKQTKCTGSGRINYR